LHTFHNIPTISIIFEQTKPSQQAQLKHMPARSETFNIAPSILHSIYPPFETFQPQIGKGSQIDNVWVPD